MFGEPGHSSIRCDDISGSFESSQLDSNQDEAMELIQVESRKNSEQGITTQWSDSLLIWISVILVLAKLIWKYIISSQRNTSSPEKHEFKQMLKKVYSTRNAAREALVDSQLANILE